jgi:translocation and assembly module TamB
VIAPHDLSNAVQASPDTVIVRSGEDGADVEDEPEGWRVHADVRVILGDEVRVNAFGLDADIGGELRIVQRPGELTSATGELRIIEGTYSIYAQTLTIENGRVIFSGGPLRDPGLDIRAVRRPRDVLVGVTVRGTLRNPRVDLFSEPPMEESQVLSYLVVGVPLDETSSSGRSNVAAAAAALASSRRGQRLAGELGIDQVTVEQAPGESGASLVLGRYLSPRLYVGYGIGLIEQANSVRVRYDLTQRWSVETRSGATSSADLLYSIETD